MASNPLFITPDFFLHFPSELCYCYLRFEGNGRNFSISFKPKVAIAEFFWKMQRKTWYSILGLKASFPQKSVVKVVSGFGYVKTTYRKVASSRLSWLVAR